MARRRTSGAYLSGNILDSAGPGNILDPLPKKCPGSVELIRLVYTAAQALQRSEELQEQVDMLQCIIEQS